MENGRFEDVFHTRKRELSNMSLSGGYLSYCVNSQSQESPGHGTPGTHTKLPESFEGWEFRMGPGVPTPLVRGCVTFMWRWVHLISCSNFPCLLLAAFFLQVASTIAASPLDVAGCWQECNLDGMKKSQRQRRR